MDNGLVLCNLLPFSDSEVKTRKKCEAGHNTKALATTAGNNRTRRFFICVRHSGFRTVHKLVTPTM
jgi:hypothetical protein